MQELLSNPGLWFSEHPLVVLLLLIAPLAILAVWTRTFPHVPLAILAMLPLMMSLGLIWDSRLAPVVGIIDVVLVLLAAVDFFTLPRAAQFAVARETQMIMSLRKPQPVSLTVDSNARRGFLLWVRDDIPQEMEAEPAQVPLRIAPGERAVVQYDLKASRRGAFEQQTVYLKVRSLFGLWQRMLTYEVKSPLNVYPDLKQLAEYGLLARTDRLSLVGMRRQRRLGQDNEFERLRDYTPDDNFKHIDWRGTARRKKLIVKDFQANQSQRVYFLVDCGRMMTNLAGGISLLDHSLNAALMLSHVALKQGDSVGLICFSNDIHTYIPAKGGMGQMNRLLHATFNRFPQMVESRYDQALMFLSSQVRKRALVVLISNVIDEVNAQQVKQYLSMIHGRHLPLGILLRDRQMFEAAEKIEQPKDLFRAAAAAEILTWRKQVLNDLSHQGVLVMDCFPEDLTPSLVNRYLEIKARHLL